MGSAKCPSFNGQDCSIHTPETEEEVSTVSDHQEAATESILTESMPPVTFEADERMRINALTETEQIPEDLNSAIQLWQNHGSWGFCRYSLFRNYPLNSSTKLQNQSNALTSNPTERLWIQYMRMVDLLRSISESWTYWKLASSSQVTSRNATLLCCSRA